MSVRNPFRRTASLDPLAALRGDSNDTELYQADDEFVLTVELPGFAASDIDLTWADGLLHVAAERSDDEGREATYYRRFRLPKRIAADRITATYNNGVLEVRLPIAAEPELPGRSIPLEAEQ